MQHHPNGAVEKEGPACINRRPAPLQPASKHCYNRARCCQSYANPSLVDALMLQSRYA